MIVETCGWISASEFGKSGNLREPKHRHPKKTVRRFWLLSPPSHQIRPNQEESDAKRFVKRGK
jgi:hypothetical protein